MTVTSVCTLVICLLSLSPYVFSHGNDRQRIHLNLDLKLKILLGHFPQHPSEEAEIDLGPAEEAKHKTTNDQVHSHRWCAPFDNNNEAISCPEGSVIFMQSATYGGSFTCGCQDLTKYFSHTYDCNGIRQCTLGDPTIYGNTCHLQDCLKVKYRCEIYHEIHTVPSETKEIECGLGEVIYIISATFPNCHNSQYTSDGKHTLERTCAGRRKCQVSGSLSPHCELGQSLDLQYMCIEGPLEVPCDQGLVTCGKPRIDPTSIPSSPRIVGGEDVPRATWPWLVKLYYDGGSLECGGAIIARGLIMTAAHCFNEGRTAVDIGFAGWVVVAGSVNYPSFSLERDTVQVSVIKEIIVHDAYDNVTHENDIAIVVLRNRLNFTENVEPICLPASSREVFTCQECMVAGWGLTSFNGNRPDVLQQTEVNVLDDITCSNPGWYGANFSTTGYSDTAFCAGHVQGGRDTCHGDSGGPLICKGDDDRWFAQGVTSRGINCGRPQQPGMYVEVSHYSDWLTRIMSNNDYCTVLLSPEG